VSVEVSDADRHRRRLGLAVRTADPAALEGSPVWLQVGGEGPTIQEESLDELGRAELDRVEPGAYTLRLYLGGQHFAVTDFQVP
jgi:hypothetical protein